MRMQDKVVLVTGGAAGIGKATAERFFEEGAIVVICDVNSDAGASAVEELGVEYDHVDISNRQAVQDWVDAVVARHGRIDVLVNNAGILRDGTLVKVKDGELVKQMTEAQFDSVIAVNLKGVFNCTQAVAPVMIRQGSGVILNATSIVGLDGNFGQTNYVATKAGVIGMTKVWARELGRYGIRVNAVAPGFTLTEMVQQMPQNILDAMVSRVPLQRMGQPRDIANAYLFLASAEASYISGEVLRVDGGIVVGT
ncbi:MAG: 3-oxoacyl-ACP reductase FabG [Anaerolineae bacterium]|nr:3-oxoacyl-ACP reductase FabG [Anaerolineae bacterium]MCO5192768.1 3-oxoacyl-ACP reductase FabG [Anaerolineae bacterium]MCO5204537.1 3-oxoacyl-ACP reductase FabG [Anaerolineae bacterium]